jgi:hypothetical protein
LRDPSNLAIRGCMSALDISPERELKWHTSDADELIRQAALSGLMDSGIYQMKSLMVLKKNGVIVGVISNPNSGQAQHFLSPVFFEDGHPGWD